MIVIMKTHSTLPRFPGNRINLTAISPVEIERETGISLSHITRILNRIEAHRLGRDLEDPNLRLPSLPAAKRLSEVLGVSLDELCEELGVD